MPNPLKWLLSLVFDKKERSSVYLRMWEHGLESPQSSRKCLRRSAPIPGAREWDLLFLLYRKCTNFITSKKRFFLGLLKPFSPLASPLRKVSLIRNKKESTSNATVEAAEMRSFFLIGRLWCRKPERNRRGDFTASLPVFLLIFLLFPTLRRGCGAKKWKWQRRWKMHSHFLILFLIRLFLEHSFFHYSIRGVYTLLAASHPRDQKRAPGPLAFLSLLGQVSKFTVWLLLILLALAYLLYQVQRKKGDFWVLPLEPAHIFACV